MAFNGILSCDKRVKNNVHNFNKIHYFIFKTAKQV